MVLIIGICNFENGMCAFSQGNSNLHWTFGSGRTPSDGTGPEFDHTTLSQKGKEHEHNANYGYLRLLTWKSHYLSDFYCCE